MQYLTRFSPGLEINRSRCTTAIGNYLRETLYLRLDTIADIINTWRTKLSSISWFMRCLNQPIAQQANQEDGCRGRFWESRFTSQALRTEQALLSCMTYVDLNPVRAQIAQTPENSEYTSIRERITPQFDAERAIAEQQEAGELFMFKTAIKPLLHFENASSNTSQSGIHFHLDDYLQLVDWTGRVMRHNKRGYIEAALPPILTRLNLTVAQWASDSQHFEAVYRRRFLRTVPTLNTG